MKGHNLKTSTATSSYKLITLTGGLGDTHIIAAEFFIYYYFISLFLFLTPFPDPNHAIWHSTSVRTCGVRLAQLK